MRPITVCFQVEPQQRPSVTSVLQYPLLEQHLRRHMDHQVTKTPMKKKKWKLLGEKRVT